ncbi:sigma-54-dependent Fis family transcriptional re gulator [Desulfonema ishimotonii]|uniref:Sigma-54-dependent Fis family transcriptional re gulator n=1 Tax=Desulfonema ishimotonii TaxID=45657 RepID=A0A401FUY6_9BACT|nr:sigma-54 dependent transcriptional regulator [Desulfonema ishimotonii]GBC60763.1 sigma-54-dependent Fis family transcriptional re gulator [Desulfonema ishimotonii]
MPERTILIVDDEPDMLRLLRRSLAPDLGCRVEVAESGKAALRRISQEKFDLILADIKMPEMDGLALLELIKRSYPDLTVVMMTGHGSIETAVDAMKNGAYDFITKPFDHDALVVRLEKALERSSLIRENTRLKKERRSDNVFQKLVGKSAAMRRVFETIRMVANTDLTVLITGESGTGKDLTAQAVHAMSSRSQQPFIPVNCPTVPEHILESELFGYRKGAFTHATRNRIGLFQEAHRGSIFLDEIGDVSPAIQTKLLRVLQEKEIKPLGDTRIIKVDVRIIASTNQNLKEKIRNGEFREDFFYRLNVLPIELPPLRERREDIPLITSHLLKKHCKKLNRPLRQLSPELMEIFQAREWAGNIRELENVVVQGILFAKGEEIFPQDVGLDKKGPAPPCLIADISEGLLYKAAKEQLLRQFNETYIGRLLSQTDGNVTQAAKLCGLERQSLQQIMRRYHIRADDFRA